MVILQNKYVHMKHGTQQICQVRHGFGDKDVGGSCSMLLINTLATYARCVVYVHITMG